MSVPMDIHGVDEARGASSRDPFVLQGRLSSSTSVSCLLSLNSAVVTLSLAKGPPAKPVCCADRTSAQHNPPEADALRAGILHYVQDDGLGRIERRTTPDDDVGDDGAAVRRKRHKAADAVRSGSLTEAGNTFARRGIETFTIGTLGVKEGYRGV